MSWGNLFKAAPESSRGGIAFGIPRGGIAMDIQESLRRILEQKQVVTQRFFTVALAGGTDGYFLLVGAEAEPQSMRPTHASQTWSAPRTIYAQFTQDLLRTLQEFHGTEWNAELMQQWQVAIERVGQAILGG